MSPLVRASFKRQVSDDHYGSETVEIVIEDTYEGNEDAEGLAAALAEDCRRLVHAELARSPSAAVRRAVAAPRPAMTGAVAGAPWDPPDYADDDGDEAPR